MENRGYDNIIIAVFMHVFVCQLFKGADRRNILNKVAALAVADGDIANSLLCCKQSLNNRNRMGYAGRNKSSRKRTVGFTVDGNTRFFVDARKPVNILPIADRLLHRDALCIGQVIGNSAALIACETARIGNFGQKARIGCAVAHLNGSVQCFNEHTAARNAVIDGGKAVKQGTAEPLGLLYAVFGFFIAVLTGVAVNGCRKQIGFAVILKISQQLDMFGNQRNARTRLNQSDTLFLCFNKFF